MLLPGLAGWPLLAMGLPPGLFTPEEERFGIHAGDMETSVMRALHPDLVQMDHARDFRPLMADLGTQHLGLTPAGKLAWAAQDLHPAGACGNAGLATAEKGRAVIAHAARQIVTLLTEVDRMPLDHLERQPDLDAR